MEDQQTVWTNGGPDTVIVFISWFWKQNTAEDKTHSEI